ncbi:MAG: dipeptidase [Anaerolineales bacterium]|nr:dipeptidase [Anaerolineales bacterium]MCX7609856.1 dipeptidase [Anaerolineales bacterium]
MEDRLIVDAHQDLAWNMLSYGRDYTRSVTETRRLEAESDSLALKRQGHTLLGWPEYQQGRVSLVFGTLFVTPARLKLEHETIFYNDPEGAYRLYRQQLETYYELTDRHPDKFTLVCSRANLTAVLNHWKQTSFQTHPVGIVPLMEGAEGIRTPADLEEWWEAGLRIIGLAWAGNRYCGGTREPGPLTDEGRALLKAMADFGFLLDISHMDEPAARQALDRYPHAVIATHANVAALILEYSGNRHLSDDVLRALIEREAVIGLVPTCRFLDYRWQRGHPREQVPFARVVDHIDYICQMAGSARHVGLGSDFDGGFGVESVPAEIDNIADLQKIVPILQARGYTEEDIALILGGNWIRILQQYLPQ